MATNSSLPPAMFQPQVGDAIQFDPAVPGGYLNTKTGQRYAPGTLFALHAGGKNQYFIAAPNGQGHYTIDPSSGSVKDQGTLGKYLLKAGLGVAGAVTGASLITAAAGAGAGAAGSAAAGGSSAAGGAAAAAAPSAISAFAKWSPWLSAAASVYGAYETGKSQDQQIAEQKREFDVQAAFNQQQADLAKARHDALVAREAPYVSGGQAAYGRLGDLLGLSPAGSLSGPSMQAPAPPPPSTSAPAGMPPTAPPTGSAPPPLMPPQAPATPSSPAGPQNSLAAFASQPSSAPASVTFKAPDGSLGTLTDPEQIRRAMADTRLQRVS